MLRVEDIEREQKSREIFLVFFFFYETNAHTQGKEKRVLIQKHTTTPFKIHGNF